MLVPSLSKHSHLTVKDELARFGKYLVDAT
jgi:hypothetical protein